METLKFISLNGTHVGNPHLSVSGLRGDLLRYQNVFLCTTGLPEHLALSVTIRRTEIRIWFVILLIVKVLHLLFTA